MALLGSYSKMNVSVGSCSEATPRRRHHHHRKFRNPVSSSYRRRRCRTPGTPLLSWKFEEKESGHGGGGDTVAVAGASARKLAAGLWQLRLLAEVSDYCGVKCGSCDRLRFQPPAGHVNVMLPLHHSNREYGVGTKDLLTSPLLGRIPSYKILHKQGSSLPYPNSVMEGVTKWDLNRSKTATEAYCFYSHVKFLEDQFTTFSVASALQAELAQARLRIRELEDEHQTSKATEAYCFYSHVKFLEDRFTTFSVASALQAELAQARLRIRELEDEHQTSKKKFENLIRKLGEERKSWHSKKHHKMRAIIDDLKDELSKERDGRKKINFFNSKLVEELAEAKSSAKQLIKDYEEEKMARQLMEEICNELATKVGEDKAEMEVLKSEILKICEEVEEERNMLLLAELWREERVQMKLVEAKLALEHKYSQMNELVAELESFLRSTAATLDAMELRKAGLIIQAVESVSIQDSKEFEYMPPESDSIYSIFEELRAGANEREMEALVNNSPICDASNYHVTSPEVNGFGDNHVVKHSNGFIASDNGDKDSGVWESVRHAKDRGSRCSLEGSDRSAANSLTLGKIASRSRIMCNENAGQHSPDTEISDVCSISEEQLGQKTCSVSELRSLASNGEFFKIASDEGDSKLSNAIICSLGTTSLHTKPVEGRQRLYVAPDTGNPHITRGMKGSIEWPRASRKTSLKGKFLKAMIESNKTHLRKVIK